MLLITRRTVLAAAGTLAAAVPLSKRYAQGGGQPENGVEMKDLSAMRLREPPVTPPDISFTDAEGTEHHVTEFVGHGMVINLWATWCLPCVAEMSALAKLAQTLGPEDIAVLPLSSDRGGAPVVQRFYATHGITALPVLLDPKSAAAHAWNVAGIPTTVVIDKRGRERGRLEGAADWSTPQAAAGIRLLVET